MATKIHYERLEAKIHPETKRLAERAALVSGLTLTDYLVRLIREDAPKTLQTHNEITLASAHYDLFLSLCNSDRPLSKEIKKTIDLLDTEGF
jgi:uncharacterized protein (DUF1778 family)